MTVPVPSLDVAAIRASKPAVIVSRWAHARWVETHEPIPGDVHLRGEHGADPISSECAECGDVLVPARFEVAEGAAALEAVSVERDEARAALARIEALHENTGLRLGLADWCDECGMTWPCPTIAALRGDES